MARTKKQTPDRQPMELNELKKIVAEFMGRYETVENEMQLLKDDQTELVEEYSDRLDMKTLKQAIRIIKIKEKVAHQDTFDSFVDILSQR